MYFKPLSGIAVLFVVSLMLGCSKEPPKCSDESTFSLVREIVRDQVGAREGFSDSEIKENIAFSVPRAAAFDEKIKKYSCEATMTVAGTYVIPIAYESQLDDKNEHVGSLQRIGRGDLIQIARALVNSKNSKSAVPDPSSTNSSAQPATPSTTNAGSNAQCFSEVGINKAISELASYKDVASSVNCEKEVYGAGKLICQNSTLKLMDSLDTKAYVYAFENGSKSEANHAKPPLDSAWISSVRNECKDEACLCTAFKAHTNSSLGGSSPYPQ